MFSFKSEPKKFDSAEALIKRYTWWSVAAGIVPIPFVDIAALTGVQIKMLYDLSAHYGVEFQKSRVKSFLTALVGGVVPASLVKAIPFLGTAAGMLTVPILAGASTHAVGTVFNQHFASGGTFLDFNPESVRGFFEEEFKKGKSVSEEALADIKSAAGNALSSEGAAPTEPITVPPTEPEAPKSKRSV